MPNLKVSIIEKVKLASGKWTNLPVRIPKFKPNGKGLYLKDCRKGNFYLLWRESGQRKYHPVHGPLRDAITAKEQKELFLASIARGLHVEDPMTSKTRLTIARGIDEFLSNLTGHGNTVPLYASNLLQFQAWNTQNARYKKTYLDQIDRQHIFAFKKWCQEQGGKNGKPNDELTAVWKCTFLYALYRRALLTELMFDYGVGVSTVNSYVVKRIDSDFFEDEGVPEATSETVTK